MVWFWLWCLGVLCAFELGMIKFINFFVGEYELIFCCVGYMFMCQIVCVWEGVTEIVMLELSCWGLVRVMCKVFVGVEVVQVILDG